METINPNENNQTGRYKIKSKIGVVRVHTSTLVNLGITPLELDKKEFTGKTVIISNGKKSKKIQLSSNQDIIVVDLGHGLEKENETVPREREDEIMPQEVSESVIKKSRKYTIKRINLLIFLALLLFSIVTPYIINKKGQNETIVENNQNEDKDNISVPKVNTTEENQWEKNQSQTSPMDEITIDNPNKEKIAQPPLISEQNKNDFVRKEYLEKERRRIEEEKELEIFRAEIARKEQEEKELLELEKAKLKQETTIDDKDKFKKELILAFDPQEIKITEGQYILKTLFNFRFTETTDIMCCSMKFISGVIVNNKNKKFFSSDKLTLYNRIKDNCILITNGNWGGKNTIEYYIDIYDLAKNTDNPKIHLIKENWAEIVKLSYRN